MTDTTVTTTPPSSPAPAAPSPSAAAPAATPQASPGSTPTPTSSTPTVPTPAAAAPSRPDWLPEQYFDPTKGPKLDEFGKHYAEIATRDAAEQVRRLALPQKAEEYKVATSAAFKPPEGVEFKIDEADPLWSQAQGWAHKHGLTQEAFNEGIDLFAGSKVGDAATLNAAKQAEIGKLGVNGPARVTALSTFFDGIGAPEMKQMLVTAPIVQAAEKLVAKFSSQGAATFSQGGREPPNPQGKVSEEQFAKMSPAARLDYTRQFDQTQFQKSA